MNILFDIGHPGHVHLFRNTINILEDRGHSVISSVRDIPIAKRLLDYYKIFYIDLGKKRNSLPGKAISVINQDYKILQIVKRNNIDVSLSSGISLSHVSQITKMKTIICDDDDDYIEPLLVKYGHRFADTVLSPSSIYRKTTKNIGYRGTHELAYLHPSMFQPEPDVLAEAGLSPGEPYFIMRFVALKGHHDIGHSGINLGQKRRLIKLLKEFGKILITSENEIEEEFEQYRIKIPPEKIHSLLYYATMFVGDSQTMTSEAAVLGTPALKCNTFAGKLSVPNELEEKFNLCYAYNPDNFDTFYNHIKELLRNKNLKKEWDVKRQKFLSNKINVTPFFVWFIENYPHSTRIMKENPDYQFNFK